MELGNLLFGNSRGEYSVERGDIEDIFWNYFKDVCDYHCYFNNSNTDRGGYENEVFRIDPYYWGDNETLMAEPNFIYKPKGIEISWYKHPMRDAYSNIELTPEIADMIFRHCRGSIKEMK